MTRKIFTSIFVSSIAVFILALALALIYAYGYYDSEVKHELTREADYIKKGIETFGENYVDLVNDGEVRITRIGYDGRVFFDSDLDDDATSSLGNHLDREEVREAISDGEGFAVRRSDTFSVRTVYYAVLLPDGSVLRVSSEYRTAAAMLADFLGTSLIMFVVLALAVFFVARGLSSSIVKPINEIDPDHPEDAEVYDELKPVLNKLIYQNRKIAKQMEELRIKQNEFASITSNMSEGMIVINSKTMILSCNDSARAVLCGNGDVPRSILGLNTSDSFRDAIVSALGGKNGYDELTLGEKHYGITVTPVFHDGAVEGAVLLVVDDTEKEMREALRREFTSNVSHELKTPLTSISGFAELIKCGMADGEEAQRFAENIHTEASRLITLVGDIIRLTRLDGGEIPFDGEIDLLGVAEDVKTRLENLAGKAGITITVSGTNEKVLGTEEILDQIIYNLADNAIKYNNPGGRVEITVGSSRDKAFVAVKDNGIGIPADKQDRVFERFYRVDKSHSKKIGGTGLGLSIVKHAVAYHKAELSLSSEEGRGTEVIVSFKKM